MVPLSLSDRSDECLGSDAPEIDRGCLQLGVTKLGLDRRHGDLLKRHLPGASMTKPVRMDPPRDPRLCFLAPKHVPHVRGVKLSALQSAKKPLGLGSDR